MPVQISPSKAAKIMQYYFKGIPQVTIAKKTGVNQATASRCASRFKAMADDIGIIAAAKEYEIMHEVDSLRSLAIELLQTKLTAVEAKEGLRILKLFDDVGVSPTEHKTLIKVISKLKEANFVPAAMKLVELEATTGKSYTEIVSEFEHLSSQVKQAEKKNAALEQQNETLKQSIKELTVLKKEKEHESKKLEKKAKQKKSELEAEVAKKMKESKLTLDRIEKLEPVVQALHKLGISDDKLEEYLKKHQELEELGIGWENFKRIVEGMKVGK